MRSWFPTATLLRQGRDGGNGTGQADQLLGLSEARVGCGGAVKGLGDEALGASELVRRRRIVVQEALQDANASQLQRHCVDGRIVGVRPHHQFGRSASNVEDEEGSLGIIEVGHRPGQREPSFLDPGQQLGGRTRCLCRGGEELGAVGCIADCRRGHQTHRYHSQAIEDTSVFTHDGDAPIDGFARELPGGIHSLSQPGDAHEALQRTTGRAPATKSLVERSRNRSPPPVRLCSSGLCYHACSGGEARLSIVVQETQSAPASWGARSFPCEQLVVERLCFDVQPTDEPGYDPSLGHVTNTWHGQPVRHRWSGRCPLHLG